jgi:hypothetical protein
MFRLFARCPGYKQRIVHEVVKTIHCIAKVIRMDMPHRTFSDVYRGQVIKVMVVCPMGVKEVADFIVHVTVTMPCQTLVPTVICRLGYESLDEARNAGVVVGQNLIDTLVC